MPKERVDEIGQGRIWTGTDALAIGLVDEIGTLDDAVRYAAVLAGDSELANWNVKGYPAPPTMMESMLGSLSGSKEDYSVKLARELKTPKIVARLPYEVKFLQ